MEQLNSGDLKAICSTNNELQQGSTTLICLLARIGAMFHDFGKANTFFSNKLKRSKKSKKIIADPFRHEWVSLRMFEAFVRSHSLESDVDWIDTLCQINPKNADVSWLKEIVKDHPEQKTKCTVFTELPPLAKLVAWLIVSHHRLPVSTATLEKGEYAVNKFNRVFEDINFNWCFPRMKDSDQQILAHEIEQCWQIDPRDIPFKSQTWCLEINICARQLSQYMTRCEQIHQTEILNDPYISHVSRMILMLSDHHYSRCDTNSELSDSDYKVYANTDRSGKLKQHLDEHLIGVSQSAGQVMGAITQIENLFDRLSTQPALETKTQNLYYQWQDRAYSLACEIRHKYPNHGFFGVNLASTGRGKTLANTRIMYGLSDPKQGARFSIALGLRTLTLQTGQALRDKLNLGADDLAIMVGGGAVKELFENKSGHNGKVDQSLSKIHISTGDEFLCLNPLENEVLAEYMGSESISGLNAQGVEVDYSGRLPEDHVFRQWISGHEHIEKMLMSPILCCTIDHLIPATESTRGGGQIAPMLRLMSSDLVFDEPDDFSPDDYYALTRLVYWAGLLGSRVLLSSATMTPAEINGLYLAYSVGRKAFNLHRTQPSQPIIAAWFDENVTSINYQVIPCNQDISLVKPDSNFSKAHKIFTEQRVQFLNTQAMQHQRRKMSWVELDQSLPPNQKWDQFLVSHLLKTTLKAHQLNAITDPNTQKKYSVGLMRFANIDPLARIAQQFLKQDIPQNVRIHLCVYHSRFPLLMRNHIEHYLDGILDRNNGKQPHDHALLQNWFNQFPEQEHIILVMASPVCEVGRDHDYDWMIAEPSSMRSIIQASGRVRRHRHENHEQANIFLMEGNIQYYKNPNNICFTQPGFETHNFQTRQHYLKWSSDQADDGLISLSEFNQLDSVSRIRANHPDVVRKNYRHGYFRLADLEHDRMMHIMLNRGVSIKLDQDTSNGESKVRFPVFRFWDSPIQFTGVLQRLSQFRKSQPEFLVALRSEQFKDDLMLYQNNPKTGSWNLKQSFIKQITLEEQAQVNCWPNIAPEKLLNKYLDTNKYARTWQESCERYLSLNLPSFKSGETWQYHDWLGFVRDRN